MKKLIIKFPQVEIDEQAEIIDYHSLKEELAFGLIKKRFFKYDVVEIISNYNFFFPDRLKIITLSFLIGKKVIVRDLKGNFFKVNFNIFFKLLLNKIISFFFKKKLKKNIEEKIVSLEEQKINFNIKNNFNSILYLRTDFIFGVRVGGFVPHISGVVNSFSKKYNIIFFTSDFIPGIKNRITQFIVNPEEKFWDFVDIAILNYNKTFLNYIKEKIKSKKIDFIYHRYSLNNFVGIELSQLFKIPIVLEYNGSEVWIANKWSKTNQIKNNLNLANKIEFLNLKKSNLIVVPSDILKKELIDRGIEKNKILVNPNGVDIDKFSPEISGLRIKKKYRINSKFVVGFSGSFGSWHGVLILAESLEIFFKKFKREDVVFLLIGYGKLWRKVKKTIEHTNLTDKVILTGVVPFLEMPEYLSVCDILLSPQIQNNDGTEFFGSPTKIFEYMAMGKAIIASKLGQIKDIIEHNKNGYLINPGEPEELADSINFLLNEHEFRKTLGINARKTAERNYSWDNHTDKIIRKLRNLC